MNRVVIAGILALAGIAGLQAQQKQPMPKSKGELEAIQAMFNAQDPDSRIAAADNLITKYADTDFKAIALQFAAASYQQKNDYTKMTVYAERTLEADPKNYMAMLMLAQGLAQHTRENDLDKEEKLAQAEKYARSAIDTVKDTAKPNPQITDEQWEGAKKDFMSQGHEALGMVAMVRKKFDVASTEFKAALEGASQPDPATMVRLGSAYNQNKMHDAAIAVLDKVMAMPDVHPQIKQFAQAERVRAFQGKGAIAKPAAPAAGAAAVAPAAPAPPAPAPAKP
jgi:tetratricopeptide (TPR) repeat protein